MKRSFWIVFGLLLLAGAWYFWPSNGGPSAPVKSVAAPVAAAPAVVAAGPAPLTNAASHSVFNPNRLAFRLTNTQKGLGQLMDDPHAILLQNALIETATGRALNIPAHLKSKGDPGAYIVQARGVIDAPFRALLAAAGARVVSYIPNNAYLVLITPAGAGALAGNAQVQAVLPYEPYYKLQPSLLGLAVEQQPLPPGTALNLGLFAADAPAAEQQIKQLGGVVMNSAPSVFGPVLRVLAPADWTALAQVPGVQVMEVSRQRVPANDLSRPTLGVAADSQTVSNYLGLTGANVLVQVNDTGIDSTHPDLTGRVFGFQTSDLFDTNGHGTHVAGIIAGDGAESMTVSNAQGSVMPATTNQFRGMAPAATLLSMNFGHSDQALQQEAALTNAPISNNSWVYGGDYDYDLAAASYDAATRDALPGTTGSQPVLFVFAAGDNGGGNDSGGGGSADTVQSPGTAKNVITVGALELPRNITNIVTTITPGSGTNAATTNQVAYWQAETDSGTQVAGYSARGNVGVQTEGVFGRFKPDLAAPGTFVVSTRSKEWDTNAFLNPTNVSSIPYLGQLVGTNALNYYNVSVPGNAVGVSISITANRLSPNPFPTDLPIYARLSAYPTTNTYDYLTTADRMDVPPGNGALTLPAIQNSGFDFAVGNSTGVPVNYDLTVTILTTNNVGDYYQVLLGMDNNDLGQFYRYESGTSMAAAEVSGVLALLEDYFTNTVQVAPSPALLKAMLINGSRIGGGYSLALTNGLNYSGWGVPNLTNSLPLTNNVALPIGPNPSLNSPLFLVDQSPANALATGQSHTYIINLDTNNYANYLPLQATLVWTDPPGDPAAAIKLVNGLTLVITNLETGEVYYGNDISPALGYNQPETTNAPPYVDTINNVQNILLPPLLAGRYSVTVFGRSVNVNAVTAQTNNVVQDYALVVSVGEGEVPTAITSVTDDGIFNNLTGDQNITFVTTTNAPLMNQFAGANTPLLGTNALALGTNTVWGPNGQVVIGMTNQWHFYVVTNNAVDSNGNRGDVTNAAFITFSSYDLSLPRTGVYADSVANATRPEADIDVYVSTDPSITNLNPVAISNCLAGTITGTANSYGAALGQGGTEFVYFTNSAPGQVYYVGVMSEDQMGSEYAFLPVFTATPFSELDKDGNLIVNGLLLPSGIPDGDNAHPGMTNVFALAIPLIPNMQVAQVTVTNLNEHQNFGDLFGAVSFGGTSVVLNNHNGLGNTVGALPQIYDDSANPAIGTTHSDGPGSLTDFRGKSAIGPWILSEMDNSLTMTGQVSQYSLKIQPHRILTAPGIVVTIPPGGWFVDYLDVPPGYTNLTFFATNLPPTIAPDPLQMYERLGGEPTQTNYDQEADLTNCIPGTGVYPTGQDPGNLISVGPPLDGGRYFIGVFNPSTTTAANVFLSATLGISSTAVPPFSYANTNGVIPLLNDAVTTNAVFVSATNPISSVSIGMVVTSPQISDYTFTLISPTGQRVLLMENRGGSDTNGAGSLMVYTNVINSTATGGAAPDTNYLETGTTFGSVPISYNFYTVPDQMTVYYGTNISPAYLIYDTGMTNGSATVTVPYPGTAPGSATILTIIMNQFGNTNGAGGDAWIYTAGAVVTNYEYLTFTDDTNLSTVPIKFAVPPYSFTEQSSNYTLSDFEPATNGNYFGPTNIYDAHGGWTVPTNLTAISTVFNLASNQFVQVTNVVLLTNNLVSVVTDPADSMGGDTSAGSNYLALGSGTITRSIPTVPGRLYNVTFWFRGPGIASWWRGEGNASDSSDPETNGNNGTVVGRFNYPAGEVGQAFGFEDNGSPFGFGGTNTYVQAPQSASLDVGQAGGFTVEGWISPTNLMQPQPLVEWLAHVPTNSAVTNLVIVAGPYLDPATSHYYYLLGATNWTASENWAEQLGGHLATIDTANEQNWVYDNFANYGGHNHNLWVGLTNNGTGGYGWISGETNVTYVNWLSSQPTNCDGTKDFTFMFGGTNPPAGLWALADNYGVVCDSPATNLIYGVAEVDNIQTNGVQFWISVTNTPGSTNTGFFTGSQGSNGCLYANIVDTNFVSHEIFSAPGLLQTNVFQHVALTFDTNSGLARLYLDGTNVATTNLFLTNGVSAPFVPKTDGDVLLGRDMTRYTNNYYGGKMDEMSIYRRALSGAEIAAIYQASTFATNGLTGKFDPSVTPAFGLAEAAVHFGATSNLIFGVNNQWEMNSFTFTATSNSMPVQITGLEPGILLDDFAVSEAPLTNLFYLPEQTLASLVGDSAYGNWTLQVWDNRNNAVVTNLSQLLSWQLQFILASNSPVAGALSPEAPFSATVAQGQTVYFSVAVPSWAKFATNILVSSDLPVNVFFNPTNLPTGANPGDLTLLTGSTGGTGTPDLAVNYNYPTLPFTAANQAGQSYYLGVQNTNIHAASVVLRVNYDIDALSNGVPAGGTLQTNDAADYYTFDVSSNAYEATFQLLNLSGNADLVVSKGVPLPTLTNSDYGSFNVGQLDENIYVLTNSSPVPLSAGTWYLGVIKRDSGAVSYTVLAKELDVTNALTNAVSIMDLTNGVPFNWTAGPGAALTNFFHFGFTNPVVGGITNYVQGVRFELYNLTGNGDLTVQTNALPLAPPFFQSSQNPGRSPELVLVYTNSALTNLAADWYLGVPNHETHPISYTIRAAIETNGYFPAFPGASGVGGGAAGGGGPATSGGHGTNGTVYHVTSLNDSGPGTLREAVSSTNRTVVFDLSGTINLVQPLVITNSYLTIAGQTAPGGGITVAGYMTTLQSAHDVIIRDVRFRRGTMDDSLMLTNVADVIVDHISAEWSTDNAMSALNSTNVTVQWSILADTLYQTNNPPPTGSLLRYGSGALSFHHNLYADNFSGSPQLGDNLSLDFVNNVIYNWGLFPGLSGGTNDLLVSTNGCTNQLNYTCNYLIAGPDTAAFATNYAITNIAFFGGPTNGLAANWIFQTNNFMDGDTNGILNGANTQWGMFTNQYTKFEHPFPLPAVPTDEAFLAYEKVLDFAGPNMALRDAVDTNIVYKVRTQTGTLISTPPLSGMVAWWKGESNMLDSVGGNNGTAPNGIGYLPGKVGEAFSLNGSSHQFMLVQTTNSALDVGQGSGFTIEGWIEPSSTTSGNMSIAEYERALASGLSSDVGVQFSVNHTPTGPGCFSGNIKDTAGGNHVVYSPPGLITAGIWQHVALTYDKTSGAFAYYLNGVAVTQTNLGSFTPQTSFTNLLFGARTTFSISSPPTEQFDGGMDEMSLFKRALSASEIQSIYLAGSAGKFAAPAKVQPYLDTDQDGIPDFWETTFGQLPYVPSNNQLSTNANFLGYTGLEEYQAWLAGPHALTVTNTSVPVDLMQLFGKTGNLNYTVTNGVNGTVYLTNVLDGVTNTGPWSNSFAIFTPTNTTPAFSGYASFDAYCTNTDTVANFGPVTVSVVVSAVPVAINSNFPPVIIPLTNAIPYPNSNSGGSDFYSFNVPTNSTGVLFQLLNPSTNVTLVARYGLPLPSLSSYDYLGTNAGPAGENIVVLTNSTPVPLTNGDWYLAAVNVSGIPVTYSAVATLFTNIVPPIFSFPTNADVFTNLETTLFTTNCVAVDSNTPPLPLTFAIVTNVSSLNLTNGTDTNLMMIDPNTGGISWTPDEAQGPSTNYVAVSVSNGAFTVTNSFTIIVEESNRPPVLPPIPDQIVTVPGTLVVTNTATDPDIPANPLTYMFLSAPTNALIDINTGVITWMPTLAQAGTSYLFTTVVTDSNPWAINSQSLSATNSFYVTVLSPLPGGQPQTNTVPAGGINWFTVNVPANAIGATNTLIFATNLPVNVWFSTNEPPTTTNVGDVNLLPNATNGFKVLTTSSTPPLVPGTTYYLGVQNTNGFPVTFALEVDFHLATLTFPSVYPISGIVLTNGSDFLLSWLAPTNDIFEVQVATNLASPIPWQTLATNITYRGPQTPTNGWFSYLDSRTNTAVPFGPIRFYQLLLTGVQTPAISGFTFTTSGLNLTWSAPTNDAFQVAWATNLVPPIAWTPFPGIITSTNGLFSFTDTNAMSLMKFYELILLP